MYSILRGRPKLPCMRIHKYTHAAWRVYAQGAAGRQNGGAGLTYCKEGAAWRARRCCCDAVASLPQRAPAPCRCRGGARAAAPASRSLFRSVRVGFPLAVLPLAVCRSPAHVPSPARPLARALCRQRRQRRRALRRSRAPRDAGHGRGHDRDRARHLDMGSAVCACVACNRERQGEAGRVGGRWPLGAVRWMLSAGSAGCCSLDAVRWMPPAVRWTMADGRCALADATWGRALLRPGAPRASKEERAPATMAAGIAQGATLQP